MVKVLVERLDPQSCPEIVARGFGGGIVWRGRGTVMVNSEHPAAHFIPPNFKYRIMTHHLVNIYASLNPAPPLPQLPIIPPNLHLKLIQVHNPWRHEFPRLNFRAYNNLPHQPRNLKFPQSARASFSSTIANHSLPTTSPTPRFSLVHSGALCGRQAFGAEQTSRRTG